MRIIGNDPSVPRQTQEVASGTLPNGKAVIVNADGTVSVVSETPVTQAVGTPVQFTSSNAYYPHAAFDSVNNKVVVVYRGSSNYGQAIVGTVDPSNNSISFGTATTFLSAYTSDTSIAFDSTNEKFVIAYRHNISYVSQHGRAIVATVSGTSISFGSPVTFNSASGSGTSTENISLAFDSNAGKMVIAYMDVGNSNYGTAIVGTVSGTDISFGSETVFNSGYTIPPNAVFDSTNNKIIIVYGNDGEPAKPTAIVGTVSGTSISFGTEVSIENVDGSSGISVSHDTTNNKVVIVYSDTTNTRARAVVGTVSGTSISFGTVVTFDDDQIYDPKVVYDSSANKHVVAYKALDNSNYGTAIVGTVSGTDISFGSEVTLTENSIEGNPIIGGTFDSANNRVIFVYRHTSGGTGKAVVFRNATTTTNVTSENYIGISRSGAASGAGAIIDTQGAIADNLSGLTAGQSYFVQTDGTLGTTAADPSVFAGTAVSATKLIVKG